MTQTATAARRSNARFLILGLVAVGTMINYLDRSVLGVAAPTMTAELAIAPAIMGLIFSAFSWTYAAAQIPGGVFLDRFGTRFTYAISVTVWSLATLVQGFVNGVGALFACRLALGVAEAPCFPANSRILSTWFPQHERARATGVYSIGQYFGLAFMSPVLFWITATMGWRMLFIIVGAAGVVFGAIWWWVYREPHHARQANKAELDYIEAGGGLGHSGPPTKFDWANIGRLLKKRQILGASIGQFAGNSTLVFFLTWFPTYLATERGMDWLKAGFYVVLPFICASIGVFLGGIVSDVLLKRTGSPTFARKAPIVAGLLLASTIATAAFVDNDQLVIAIMSVAFFGQGLTNLGWTLISDVAPKRLMGLTGGVFNLCANVAGILTPLVIGFVVSATGSFLGGLAYIGVVALIGVFSYVVILGPVERVDIDIPEKA